MPIAKVCCRPGCDDLAADGGPHCPTHAERERVRLAERRARAKRSDDAMKGAALYATREWKDARRAFLRDHPTCRDCGDMGLVIEATEVDHITPHRGDRRVFWNRQNWQALCKPCHSRKTAREVFHPGGV